MSKIPVYLIHGSLGSGKTTLIKNILKNDFFSESILIENEFASENIDNRKIQEDGHTHSIEISGGCICCSSGKELEDALKQIINLNWDNPVIIETTGVANSVNLIQSLFLNPDFIENFRIVKNVYVLDPLEVSISDIEEKSIDIKLSDFILINKIDLVTEDTVKGLEEKIKLLSPNTEIIHTVKSKIDPKIFSKNKQSNLEQSLTENIEEFEKLSTKHSDLIYSVYKPNKPINKVRFEESVKKLLDNKDMEIKRVKGYVHSDNDTWWRIETTKNHYEIEKVNPQDRQVIVLIGKWSIDIEKTLGELLYG